MNDVFLEERVVHLLNRNERFYRTLALVFGFGACMLAVLFLPRFPLLAVLVIFAVFWGVRRYLKTLNREYEYAFTNGELDIDVIFNKEWRKRLYSLDLRKDLLSMLRADSPRGRERLGRLERRIDVGRGPWSETTWLMVVRHDGKEVGLLWDPSEKMFEACRRVAPRQVEVEPG